ncbi:hypothetical protein MIND_00498700 [Mycena indigotica]|uniref:Uncharacterized protein n=1 Tax=Mycena indigotica TaxID=2126181 RepID=A0A8H6SX62_9AGAR|nr:uncharacterized protein MIND_00498700 [Mycena indigotica]KAF7307056.1 hypothetical protein MIND_00498700 [Mycena indigotica]
MAARVHNHGSNRAKPRETIEKKEVFKGVLDSPYRVAWPLISTTTQIKTKDIALEFFKNFSSGRRGKRPMQDVNDSLEPNKRRKTGEEDSATVSHEMPPEVVESEPAPVDSNLRKHVYIGINQVTRRLEAQLRSSRKVTVIPTTEPQQSAVVPLKLILVCRADVDPHILIEHLPQEIAAFNSTKPKELVKMLYLPAGAEAMLAEVIGIRRLAVIGLDVDTPGLDKFDSVMQEVDVVTAPWLTSSVLPDSAPIQEKLLPTHVKQMRTTAPKDMKLAKLLRAEGKNAAKKIRKAKDAARKAKAEEEKNKKKETEKAS